MKKLYALLGFLCLAASCDQKTGLPVFATKTDAGKNTQPAKFEDPLRINTCDVFINDIKGNDIKEAMSLTDQHHFVNAVMNKHYIESNMRQLERVQSALNEFKVTPKEKWIVRYDTLYQKIDFGDIISSYIMLSENIIIPLDKGQMPVDSQLYVCFSFDITDFDATPNTIEGMSIVHHKALYSPTRHKLDNFRVTLNLDQ